MPAPHPITVRLDKLRFLVEELELAFEVSRWAPDAWEGRMIARHILIRARDFIEHARALRRPLRAFGPDGPFNALKETYAGWFDEYFATARDRMGAHIQDLDFGGRIELWTEIETSKAHVFVDGAREIYQHLSGFSLPGYGALQPLPELGDEAFLRALEALRRSGEGSGGMEVSTDPLAMTRPNTSAMLNDHPIHARAGQLNLIARWIRSERAELQRFARFPRVVRILRARLLTDTVSFADCLVTRPLAPTAPQYMKALDEILRDEGRSSTALASLVTDYRFEDVLDRLRPQRNTFAAHLEVDDALSSLLTDFDALDWNGVEAAYDTLDDAFRAACGEDFLLSTHLTEGRRLKGVVPARETAVTPYDPTAPAPPTLSLPAPLAPRSAADYRRALAQWLRGGEPEREAAETFLSDGFGGPDGQPFSVQHDLGGGQRLEPHVFTAAHSVVLDALLQMSGADFAGVLQLLALQRSRYPARAAEVVVRYAEASPTGARRAAPQLCWLLGGLASWDAPRHTEFLRRQASPQRDWMVRREAILALFKAFVRTEGLRRINSQTDSLDLDREFNPFFSKLALARKLELRLAMASAFCDPLATYRKPFAAELATTSARAGALAERFLARQGRGARAPLVDKLLASEDFVGVVLLLAEGPPDAVSRGLLRLVQDGTVVPARHDQAGRNLIGCFWRAGAREEALQVAERLAARNPTKASDQILRLEIRTELRRDLAGVRAELLRLRSDFKLTSADEARLAAIEVELTAA